MHDTTMGLLRKMSRIAAESKTPVTIELQPDGDTRLKIGRNTYHISGELNLDRMLDAFTCLVQHAEREKRNDIEK